MHPSTPPSSQRQRQQQSQQAAAAGEQADKEASSASAHSTAATSTSVLPSPHSSPPPSSLLPPLPPAVASYPTISYHALQRAEKTIADFVQSYLFIFHAADDDHRKNHPTAAAAAQGGGGADPPVSPQQLLSLGLPSPSTLQRLFAWLPLLTFVSATIYQLDEENEERNQRERERREGGNSRTEGGAQVPEDRISVHPSAASTHKSQKRTRSTTENDTDSCPRLKRLREEGDEAHSSHPTASSSPLSRSSSSNEEDSASQFPVRSISAAASSSLHSSPLLPSAEESTGLQQAEEEAEDSDAADESPSYSVLLAVLRSKGLLTPRVEDELRKGRIYWQLERKICRQLVELEEYRSRHTPASSPSSSSPSPPSPLSPSDVHLASRCKSFDYRVLHLLCFGLRGAPADDAVMKALSFNERLVDLHDDLVDYEDDVLSNSFNLYRCYVSLYGAAQAPAQLLQLIQQLERQFDTAMSSLLSAQRAAFRAREQRAMQEHGRPTSSSSSFSSSLPQDGSVWSVPPPIANERAWRAEVQQAEQASMQLQADYTTLS